MKFLIPPSEAVDKIPANKLIFVHFDGNLFLIVLYYLAQEAMC